MIVISYDCEQNVLSLKQQSTAFYHCFFVFLFVFLKIKYQLWKQTCDASV